MFESITDNSLFLPVVLTAAFAVGWLLKTVTANQTQATARNKWQTRLDEVLKHRNHLNSEIEKLRSSVEAQEAVINEREVAANSANTELASALEREKMLTKNIFTLRSEREDFKTKMTGFQRRMTMLQQQSAELQSEFVKARDFYVGELTKSFEKRKAVEEKLENSRQEHESLGNLLSSAKSEHESVNRMLAAAKHRLEKLDSLEDKVVSLETENAELKRESARLKQEVDVLQRDVDEFEELKVQSREMSEVLKSMESSRKQHEENANRYREQVEREEQKSATLALRLDEVEQNFLEIEQQQSKALKKARHAANTKAANEDDAAGGEVDDLKEIVGIGKKFEESLNEIGVVSFRQIANFDVSDIARVNAKLKEFSGRMEQDDWIGQARELLYRKYGAA